MVKRKLRVFTALLLACVMVCTFVSCATPLRGKYTSKESGIEHSFTFKEDNKVGVSAFDIEVEGDYVIENGEITITYKLFGLKYNWTKSFEKDGNSIFIDGTEFIKEK